MTPEEALRQFQQTTGLQVFAVLDRDGTAWWAKGEAGTPTFECTIGDRFLHIDELASGVTGPPPQAGPDRCSCGELLYSPAEAEAHNRQVHNVGPVATTSWGAEP